MPPWRRAGLIPLRGCRAPASAERSTVGTGASRDPVLPWRQVRPVAIEAMRCIPALHLTRPRNLFPDAHLASCRLVLSHRNGFRWVMSFLWIKLPVNAADRAAMKQASATARLHRLSAQGDRIASLTRRSVLLVVILAILRLLEVRPAGYGTEDYALKSTFTGLQDALKASATVSSSFPLLDAESQAEAGRCGPSGSGPPSGGDAGGKKRRSRASIRAVGGRTHRGSTRRAFSRAGRSTKIRQGRRGEVRYGDRSGRPGYRHLPHARRYAGGTHPRPAGRRHGKCLSRCRSNGGWVRVRCGAV